MLFRRRDGGNDRRGDDRRDNGRKLQQNVGQIVCDALGNCDDGRYSHEVYLPPNLALPLSLLCLDLATL